MYKVRLALSSFHLKGSDVKAERAGPGILKSGEDVRRIRKIVRETIATTAKTTGDSKTILAGDCEVDVAVESWMHWKCEESSSQDRLSSENGKVLGFGASSLDAGLADEIPLSTPLINGFHTATPRSSESQCQQTGLEFDHE